MSNYDQALVERILNADYESLNTLEKIVRHVLTGTIPATATVSVHVATKPEPSYEADGHTNTANIDRFTADGALNDFVIASGPEGSNRCRLELWHNQGWEI